MGNILSGVQPPTKADVWNVVASRDAAVYSFIIIASCQFYWTFIQPYFSPLRKIPGFSSFHPIYGNMRERDKQDLWPREYGLVMRFYFFFGSERVFVADPDILKKILVIQQENFIKPPNRLHQLKSLMGHSSVLLVEREEHAAKRKLMNPTFGITSIKGMVPAFQKYAEKLQAIWSQALETEGGEGWVSVPVQTDLTRLTLDVIGRCAFGYEFDSLENSESERNQLIQRLVRLEDMVSPWTLLPFYKYFPTKQNKRFYGGIKLLDGLIFQMIKERRELLQHVQDQEIRGRDLLSLLMLAKDQATGEGMLDIELRDQVATFMFAGHETTATSMTWAFLQLADHPDVQDRVREEVRTVLPPQGKPLNWEHVEKLKYLTCVINETLRFSPTVPTTLRMNVKDLVLGGYFIPARTVIVLGMGAMMRHPDVWSDPDTFNPDRFLDHYMPSTFLPFISGVRQCIGWKFAMIEMKVVMAILLRDLRFERIPGTDYVKSHIVTSKPKPPVELRITKV